ncbi:hypothetical protein RDWZM_004882 [Blomia tropicalis]|uniref:BHLH domain-containing protein n=1 Tax=Blomia tropicalis TaxID=40697 RepID=A0A9Q0RM27_BLOTA|nr:hypothetical protein RDWZM_004882 [Blomia tropicalis]
MTKIAYLRASQQNPSLNFHQPTSPIKTMSQCPTSPNRPVMFAPPMPGSHQFPPPSSASISRIGTTQIGPQHPKPMMMLPTTRFNSNPTVLLADQSQGGRISKPLMEKRRRARINQCLSQLKQIVVDSAGQHTQNNKCKLEKADILELTVKYVKKLHQEVSNDSHHQIGSDHSPYISGYSDCIRQMVDYVSDIAELGPKIGQTLQSHFSQRLYSIQMQQSDSSTTINDPTPPSPPNSVNSNSSLSPNSTINPYASIPFCMEQPLSPALSSQSSSTSSSTSSSLPEQSNQSNRRNLKRTFQDDVDEEEEEEDEDDDQYYYDDEDMFGDMSRPINLSRSKVNKTDKSEAWRPW